MTLPAIGPQQVKSEAARQFHERLWDGFLCGYKVLVPSTPETVGKDLIKLSGSLHRFWGSRGYTLHCKRVPDRTGMFVWLERTQPFVA